MNSLTIEEIEKLVISEVKVIRDGKIKNLDLLMPMRVKIGA